MSQPDSGLRRPARGYTVASSSALVARFGFLALHFAGVGGWGRGT
jgi:hypothetical protein